MSEPLYRKPQGVQTRWASPENFTAAKGAAAQSFEGRKGSAHFPLPAGASRRLFDVTGSSGVLRRMWFTMENRGAEVLRGLRIDIYWDNATRPAVSAPFGDFFSQTLGRTTTFESALFSNPEGRSFNCLIPMPFRNACRVELINESGIDIQSIFYDIQATLGDVLEAGSLYFHCHWRRENPTRLRDDFELLPRVTGAGRFLGVCIGVIAQSDGWWGEGEVKIYLDGDADFPSLCGTGTEDYIGTAWGQGVYAHHYQGCPIADTERKQYGFYRLHVPDPVYFDRDIRVTMQQLGVCGPTGARNNKAAGTPLYRGSQPLDFDQMIATQGCSVYERQDDWCSCAYFYLDQPENRLPPLAPPAERIAGLVSAADATKRTDLQP